MNMLSAAGREPGEKGGGPREGRGFMKGGGGSGWRPDADGLVLGKEVRHPVLWGRERAAKTCNDEVPFEGEAEWTTG